MQKKNKVHVSKDTSFEVVVESDKNGAQLVWDPKDFRSLQPEELKQLSKLNRDRYEVFRELAEEEQKRSDVDEAVMDSFTVGDVAATATERLRLHETRDGYVARWERPDMVEVRKSQGWKMATKGYRSHRGGGSGIHRIGSKGQEELVLMEIPEKEHEKLQKQKLKRRQRAIEGVANQAKSEIERLGGGSVDESTSGDFKSISHEGGN